MPLLRRQPRIVATSRVRSTLRASAQRISLANKKAVPKETSKRQEWQDEAWGYFDDVPEVKYSVWFMGNVMSKIRLFVAVRNPEDPEADPVPISDPNSGIPPGIVAQAMAELQRLQGPLGGLPEICRELNMNLEIAAECYLVGWGPRESKDEFDAGGEPMIIEEEWDIRSVSEVIIDRANGTVKVRNAPDDQSPRNLDKEIDTIIRIWQRHPRWSMMADCNMRAVLNECEALTLLSNQVKAEAKSHMGAGFLLVPNELADDNDVPTEGEEGEEAGEDAFMQLIYEGVTEPVEDPGSAAAVAPILLRGPTESLKEFRHVLIGRPLAAELEARIQARVERLARGMNLPVETVLGHQSTTFSNAAQIAQDQFADHFYPRCVLLVDALTVSFLQPNLVDALVDPDIVDRLCIWFDPAGMIKQTDLSVTAKEGHDLGALSDAAWRRVMGWSEDDAPGPVERLLRATLKLRSIDPGLTTAILELLGVPLDIPAVVPAGKVTADTPTPAPSEVALDSIVRQAAELHRQGRSIDLQSLIVSMLAAAQDNGGDIGDTAKSIRGVLDDLERIGTQRQHELRGPTMDLAALASAGLMRASKRNVGHDLMAIDRELRAKLLVAADRQMTRLMERAGNKLRSKGDRFKGLVRNVNPIYAAATLGPALVAQAGFTDGDLLGVDPWATLGQQFLTWGADAQKRSLDKVAAIVSLSDSARADVELGQDAALHAAWDWLRDQLDALSVRRLYEAVPSAPDRGEFDATCSIPVGLIRQAIARAGGATGIVTGQTVRGAAQKGGLDVTPQDSIYVALDNSSPLGGIGTGADMMNVLADGSVGVDAYEWTYGPAMRVHPFEEHEALDGEIFDTFDSDVLAAGDWIGDFYFPGDHDGCNCDITPIIAEAGAVLDSLDITPPSGGSDVATEDAPGSVAAIQSQWSDLLTSVPQYQLDDSGELRTAWINVHSGDPQADEFLQAVNNWSGTTTSSDRIRSLLTGETPETITDLQKAVVARASRDADTLAQALDNAPVINGMIYRGIGGTLDPAVGETLTIGPSSFTRSYDIAQRFGINNARGGTPGITIIEVVGSRGVPLDALSMHPTEQEVISGGRFVVQSVIRSSTSWDPERDTVTTIIKVVQQP
jgi:hypothetical protein